MDGNLANAGAAEGGTMEGADRRGESYQSHKISELFERVTPPYSQNSSLALPSSSLT